jgi:hypothetical protein
MPVCLLYLAVRFPWFLVQVIACMIQYYAEICVIHQALSEI